MGKFFRVIGRILVGLVLVVAVLVVATEGLRRDGAVERAVAKAKSEAETERKAAVKSAVDKAVAETEARAKADAPVLPTIETRLDADPETRALFPKGAYLAEVKGKYQEARCKDLLDVVHWVRLEPDGRRSTMERQKPDGAKILVGLLSFGLSAFYGKEPPVQTIFSAKSEGPYTTIVLGALRNNSDAELVAPQVRLTLYRLDNASFGLVERALLDEPAAARPLNRAPKFSKVLRRCAYQDGVTEL